MKRQPFLLVFCVIYMLFLHESDAQVTVFPFDTTKWDLGNSQVIEHLGRQSLMGTAYLKDVEFENGIIEVDIAVSGQKARTYPGLLFRIQSPGNYERFYIRPHRASLYPDAVQYTPGFNGIDGWQLYNGEGYTASADIPDNRWVHFKLEVSGSQARLYIDNNDQPALVINQLKHGISKGTLALLSPMDQTAFFSNFTVQKDNTVRFDRVLETEPQPGIIKNWEISQPFPFSSVDLEKHPDEQTLEEIRWQNVTSESSGLVDVSRYYGRTGREPDCILARTVILSGEEKVMQLMFGYSDLITIFLNGKRLFFGNSLYQGRDPSFLGIIGYNDAVYLPLIKGENELVFWITESFGGWGFMAKDGDAQYLREDIHQAWKIEKDLRAPESVVYDKKRNILYVTNYDGYGRPGQQFISRVSPDGKIQNLKWVENLVFPTGLSLLKDKLFVVERRNVAEISLDTGTIMNRYPLPQPMFPNDITVDTKGNMYVSDTRKGAIYTFTNGQFEEWLKGPELAGINGLYIYKNALLAGITSDHSLKSIDIKTKAIKTIVRFSEGNMDGIKTDKEGNFLISHYEGRIYQVTPSGEAADLIYLSGSRCADFEYIPEQNIFIVPALEANEMTAFRWMR